MAPNDRWSLDFVSDQLTDGRRFRILTVVDDCTRECLALVADTSLSGTRVARELDRLMMERGKPKMVVSDNGSELTGNAILTWADQSRVAWHYIAPGKPMQNASKASMAGCAPHVALRAAMRSMRLAISLLFIDPPHTHEKLANSSLERSKNRCASPTLSPVKPASCRTLSFAASANAELGCAR
jgi:transposase InsO family protein